MNKLNEIRKLLGLKVVEDMKFATATLTDGTKIETEGEWAVGSTVYVVGEDGTKMIASPGVHRTETAEIEVDPNGQILRITEAAKMAEVPEEKPEVELPVEAIKEIVKELIDEEMKRVKTSMEVLLAEVETMKTELGKTKDQYNQIVSTPAAEPLKTIFSSEGNDELDRKLKLLKKKDLFPF